MPQAGCSLQATSRLWHGCRPDRTQLVHASTHAFARCKRRKCEGRHARRSWRTAATCAFAQDEQRRRSASAAAHSQLLGGAASQARCAHLPRSKSRSMELHSAAILDVWLKQSASWPRSRGGPLPAATTAAASAALAFLRRPMAACYWLGQLFPTLLFDSRAREQCVEHGKHGGVLGVEPRGAL
jgi:hypothetical protein